MPKAFWGGGRQPGGRSPPRNLLRKFRPSLKGRVVLFAVSLFITSSFAAGYLPPRGDAWATHAPQQEGFDPAKLQAAIDFAVAHEAKVSPALARGIDQRDHRLPLPLQFAGPFSDAIGPLTPHAPANGIVIRHGYIVAEWGDPHKVDMTHSVTKTFLSSVAGVAFDKHMIRD